MGALTLRSVGASVSGTGTLTPGMPAGWQPGDLVGLLTGCVSTSETLTAATVGAGWVEAASPSVGGLKLFIKVAQEGDTAPSFGWSGTSNSWAQLAAFDGDVYTDLSTIVANLSTRVSVTTRPKIWALTVGTDNCLIITASRLVKTAVSNGTTYSSPLGSITELGEYEANGTNIAMVWGYQMQAAKANVAEASWSPHGTAETENQNFLAFTVALKTSSATVNAQGAGVTTTASASTGQAQGSSGVSAQGGGAVATAVAAMATVSTDTQQIIVVSGTPAGTAISLKTLFSPAAVDGDVLVVDKVTAPGGYPVTVNADGTFRFDSFGDESRQTIGVDLIQASNGRKRGRGYVAVNSVAPQFVDSGAGFFEATPITPFVPIDRRLYEQIRDPQSGGTLTFELLAGPLPPGLKLTRGGRLHGVPITLGTYPITIGVRDEFGALTIVDDIIDVAYGASGAGVTAAATAATATARVSVTASGAGVSDTVTAAGGSASGGGGNVPSMHFDFNSGTTGASVLSYLDDKFGTNGVFSTDGYGGTGKAMLTTCPDGSDGFSAGFGTILRLKNPNGSNANLVAGDELWWRVRTKFAADYNFGDASPFQKFLRVKVSPAGEDPINNAGRGHIDLYIDRPSTPEGAFHFVYEGQSPETNNYFGSYGSGNCLHADVYETIEFYVKLGTSAGTSKCRCWRNGVLIGESSTIFTLSASNDFVGALLCFTYVNGTAQRDLSVKIDDLTVYHTKGGGPPNAVDSGGHPCIGMS